jgi:hypothetical protein
MRNFMAPERLHARRQWPIAALVASAVGVALGLLWWLDPARTPVPLCTFYAMTGLHCPGCGTLRATHELLHGHPLAALHDNAIWTLSLPLLSYLGGSQLWTLLGHRPWPGDVTQRRWFWIGVAMVAAVFCVLRNLPWEPFTWLAPLR